MKFDFRRLTPALVTSLALLFLALLCASIGWVVFAWVLGLVGLALNVVAVAVVQIDGASRADDAVSDRTSHGGPGTGPSAQRDSARGKPLSDKAKNARAALRDSASRSGRGSTSTGAVKIPTSSTAGSSAAAAGPKTASAQQSSKTADAARSTDAADGPKITKRF